MKFRVKEWDKDYPYLLNDLTMDFNSQEEADQWCIDNNSYGSKWHAYKEDEE